MSPQHPCCAATARCNLLAQFSQSRRKTLNALFPTVYSVTACDVFAGFMGELVPPNRKALAVYPLFLFYTSIGWLILIAAKRS